MDRVRKSLGLLLLAPLGACSLLFSSEAPVDPKDCTPLSTLLRQEALAYYPADDLPTDASPQYIVEGGVRTRNAADNGDSDWDAAYESIDTIDFGVEGVGGRAIEFRVASESSQMLVPNDVIDLREDFSVEFLVNVRNGAPAQNYGGLFIFERYLEDDGGTGFRLGTDLLNSEETGDFRLQLWCDESGCDEDLYPEDTWRSATLFARNQWHHVALVHSIQEGAHQARVYVNQHVEIDANPFPMVVAGLPSQFSTGFGGISGKDHKAAFDEMAIYRRALSQEDIDRRFHAFEAQLEPCELGG